MNNYIKLTNNLETLKLYEIKNRLESVIERNNQGSINFTDGLYELTERELEYQKERAKVALVKVANFPFQKTFNDFDFNFQPLINRQEILDLKYDLLEEENIYTKEYLGSISHQEIISKITS